MSVLEVLGALQLEDSRLENDMVRDAGKRLTPVLADELVAGHAADHLVAKQPRQLLKEIKEFITQ
jgi:hypothetical protein